MYKENNYYNLLNTESVNDDLNTKSVIGGLITVASAVYIIFWIIIPNGKQSLRETIHDLLAPLYLYKSAYIKFLKESQLAHLLLTIGLILNKVVKFFIA